jgi:two-component system chemotaxis response regulator CheY
MAIPTKTAKILVVDDHPSVRIAVIRELDASDLFEKFNIVAAANGREALELVHARGDFDVVLTDTNMPEMNGLDLTRGIRASTLPKQPIIVGMSTDDTLASAYKQAGAQAFWVKSDTENRPPELIETLLNQAPDTPAQ